MEEDQEGAKQDAKQGWGLPAIGIPSEILWNPLFSNTEKVLYGFLKNLSSQPEGCFATNLYLGNLVGVTKNSTSRMICRLKTAGYIDVTETEENGYKKRVIKICEDLKKYNPLIKLIYPKIKKRESWYKEEEVLGLSEKITGLSRGSIPLIMEEYTPHHGGVYPSPWRMTNEYNNKEKNINEEFKCSSKEEQQDFDKSDASNNSDLSLVTDSVAHKNKQVEIKENNTVDLNKKVPRKLKQPVVKEKPKPVVSKEIENLIIFWNGLNIVTHRPNTKTYYEIANCLSKLMTGNFFDKNGPFVKYSNKKFTSQEITETMTRFALAATNFNYLPISDYKKILKKTGIIHFLHNPFGKQEKSLFLEYFENPPQLLKEETRLTTDDDPDTTRIIKSFWVKKVLGGIEPVSWSNQDENNFRRAGKSLTKFIKSNIKRITTEFGLGGDDIKAKRDRVELLFESILDDINDDTSKLTTGWLCSSMTWNTRFPKYLFAQGIIEEE